ncbi:MAG: winged helix-turn-helix domain-containing protein [Thaumarchaeota archaeon]|nr:winged helix-turn-helix domain-containing protein [Nitrososphaerota archaeon]
MVRMAQEIQEIGGREGFDGIRTRAGPFKSDQEEDKILGVAQSPAFHSLGLSGALLSALGDESSRKILTSAITSGKTVEEISAEQNLPLSTCYRRMRGLLGDGLMILERTVVTPAGKRYAVYRTSFSRASISFDGGEVAVELTPNMDIIDKLRRKWLSENYPLQNQDDRVYKRATPPSGPMDQSRSPFG